MSILEIVGLVRLALEALLETMKFLNSEEGQATVKAARENDAKFRAAMDTGWNRIVEWFKTLHTGG